jgi:hypothetical protein
MLSKRQGPFAPNEPCAAAFSDRERCNMSLKNLTEKYEIIEQVGEGTYGYAFHSKENSFFWLFRKVYKGKCLRSGKLVALKKFRIETEKEGVINDF